MRRPGIEPGSKAWEAFILPLNHQRLKTYGFMLEPTLVIINSKTLV